MADYSEDQLRKDMKTLKEKLHERGRRNGPEYHPIQQTTPWYDQFFQRDITPTGEVECEQALRVGATQNGLDVALIASHSVEEEVKAESGATITLTLLEADSMDGEFTEVGPTICVKAPEEGVIAPTDGLLFRFPLGNFQKAWLKVKLTFTGTISGGNLDCALAYAPR